MKNLLVKFFFCIQTALLFSVKRFQKAVWYMHYNYTRYQQRKKNVKKSNKMKSSLGRKSFHVASLTFKIVL